MRQEKFHKSIEIHASTKIVYKVFTSPHDIRQWYGTNSQLALRNHGHFTTADLTGDVYESGEFLEVKADELLRYTFEHHGFYKGSEVTVKFEAKSENQTRIDFTHAHLTTSDLEHAGQTWDWALGNLKTYIETGTTQTFQAWLKQHS